MLKNILLPGLIFLVLNAAPGTAQISYTVNHYTSENGLPQNSVKSIAADSDGFIWLATEDGLTRFDGRSFYVFNQSNLDITSNRIVEILPSLRKASSGSRKKGHERIDVTYCTNPSGEAVRIQGGRAVRDTIYGYNRAALFKSLNQGAMNVINVSSFPAFWTDNSKDYQIHIILDGNGDRNFYRCDSVQVSYYQNLKEKYKVTNAADNLWNYFSLGERLYYFNKKRSFIQIFKTERTAFEIEGDILNNPAYRAGNDDIKFYWNNNSDQAFLYLSKNLYELEQRSDGRLVTKLICSDFDLVRNKIDLIHFDKIGEKIYLGSVSNGLYVLSRQQFKALTVSEENYQNIFYAQLPYKNNTIVTSTGIIVGYDDQTNRITDKRSKILEEANPSDKRVFLRDKRNTIWVKNFERLIHLSPDEKRVEKKWVFKKEVKAICQDEDSTIWVGVIDHGLYRLNPNSQRAEPEFFVKGVLKYITFLETLDRNQLLIGTLDGLYRLDIAKKKITLVQETKGVFIKSIYVSGRNEVWVTGEGKGLMLMNEKGDLVTFPLDRNRYLASAHCILNDGMGYLWVPTNKGLFQIAKRDLLQYANLFQEKEGVGNFRKNSLPGEIFYMYHAMDEGFKTNEFNGNCMPCGLRLANGYISLPSLMGLVWFRPQRVRHYFPDGKIVLDRAEMNRKLIQASGDTIRFPLSPENITLFFSTAYFGNGYNLNASYTLVKAGSKDSPADWKHIDSDNFNIQLPGVGSGDYILYIRKLNGFGINNYTVKKIYLIVPREWYETFSAITIFAVLLILLLGSSFYFYNRYKLRSIIQENARLEETIAKRTEKLNQTLLGLQASRKDMDEQIHLLSRLVTSISHDVQSPLRYIAFSSRQIPQMLKTNQFDDISKLGTLIFDMSDRMSTQLQDLLDFIKVQVYGKRIHFEPVDLRTLVDDKVSIFKKTADLNSSHFINDIPYGQTVVSDYQLLSIVVHNLIDNAAKYTYNGKIRLYMNTSGRQNSELLISNTESGIPLDVIEMLNSPVKEKSLEEFMESGKVKGLGLLIVKEVGELADIDIKVTQGDVTIFHLLFDNDIPVTKK